MRHIFIVNPAAGKPETTAHDGTMSLKFCLQLHQAYLDGKKK